MKLACQLRKFCAIHVAAVTLGLAGCTTTQSSESVSSSIRMERRTIAEAQGKVESTPEVDEPKLDGSATLQDYLAYAALNNAGLEAAFNRWRAAVERIPQVEALPDPKFTYRYFIREVETRLGPQEQAAGVSQSFPWFGKLDLRGDVASEAAKSQYQRYEATKLALFYEVKDAFNEYYYLGRAITVVQENLDLVEYLEGVARARYRTAAATHPDVIRAQVELGKLEDQLNSLRDLRSPVIARLNAVLNRHSAADLPFPSDVGVERLGSKDEAVLRLMAEHNPELRALDHAIRQTRYEVELAQKEYYPDVTLGVDYTDVGQPFRSDPQGFSNPAALRSASRLGGGMGDLIDVYALGRSFTPGARPDDAGQDIWVVSLSMNLPIWRNKYAAGEREARARQFAATHNRHQREFNLSSTVKRALYNYRDAERKIVLYRDTLIPKAKESLESTETAFRAGNSSFLDLVDAERSLLDFELSYERALTNRSSRLAELDRLVGIELPRLDDSADGKKVTPEESNLPGN